MSAVLYRTGALIALVLALAPALARADGPQRQWLAHTGARLGIQVQSMTPALRAYFRAERDRGILVSGVMAGSPAAEAGLKVGDVILSADAQPLGSPPQLIRVVTAAPDGEPLELAIVRRGEMQRLSVTPRPSPQRGWVDDTLGDLRKQMRALERRLRELEERFEAETAQKHPADET